MLSSQLLQEISVVKGSGKVEQAKNIKARKLGNRKNRSESSRDNLKRQESNFAETKKRPCRRPIQRSLKRLLVATATSMDSGDTQAHFETSLKVQ